MNLLPAVVHASDPGGVTVALPGGLPITVPVAGEGVAAGQSVTLGMRPEHLGIGEAPGGVPDAMLAAQVQLVEHLGGEILAHVVLADGTALNVKTHGHGEVTRAGMVEVGVRGALCYLFDAAGDCLAPLHPRDLP